ncbi:uncharacterized protein LOC122253135 isoform X2 [Penaeus japonicus]|uniref:uncharacterized protein LOC122253135 isoform X2 n=1 Tax=Penaeus japonicus TaxID=27405 RepID=UPI001C70D5E8|nr:uncharacterized protein LOC122253135 isoform X2 [Penaeus japonicus]
MADVIRFSKEEPSNLSLHNTKMIAADQLSGVQKTSAGYSYRRVPVARSPNKRLDALKEKHQMLLEAMRRQFNMEVSVERVETDKEGLEEKPLKIDKKQITSLRNCKPIPSRLGAAAQDADKMRRESKSSSQIQLDCYVKLIPLRSSLRRNVKGTRKEEQALATDTIQLDVPNTSTQCKKMADVDHFPKLLKTSAGYSNRRLAVPRSASKKPDAEKEKQDNMKAIMFSESNAMDSREPDKESCKEKSRKLDKKQITSSKSCKSNASGLRTEAQEINKTRRRNAKGAVKEEQVGATDALKLDVPNTSAQCKADVEQLPKVQNTSRGHRQWPTTVNTLATASDKGKEKHNILKSVKGQVNIRPPKYAQGDVAHKLGSCNGNILKILESMREQFNGEAPVNQNEPRREADKHSICEGNLPKDSSTHPGQKVPPHFKQESQEITSSSPNTSVKTSCKRNVVSSCNVLTVARESERISKRKGGSPECPGTERKTSQTEKSKRQCRELAVK